MGFRQLVLFFRGHREQTYSSVPAQISGEELPVFCPGTSRVVSSAWPCECVFALYSTIAHLSPVPCLWFCSNYHDHPVDTMEVGSLLLARAPTRSPHTARFRTTCPLNTSRIAVHRAQWLQAEDQDAGDRGEWEGGGGLRSEQADSRL